MKKIDCVVIPARGGSKRILHKNMQPFLGIPMIQRSINLAKEISNFVIVSSDDLNILEEAKKNGAYPLKRDTRLADDFTPTLPVIIDAIKPFINDKKNKKINNNIKTIESNSSVLCLYATAMFATKDLILQAHNILEKYKNATYIVSILENKKIFRSFKKNNGFIEFIFPNFMNTRSQDLEESFCDAGQFYLGYAKSFLSQIPLLGEKSMGIELKYGWDIDTPLDLTIAEVIFKYMNEQDSK